MAADIVPVRYFCKSCGWAADSSLILQRKCGRCGVLELEELSTRKEQNINPFLLDKKQPIDSGAMMSSTAPESESAQILPSQSSNTAAALTGNKPKKNKKVLGNEEKISPEHFASPPPTITISLDQVKKREVGDTNVPQFHIDEQKIGAIIAKTKQTHVNRRSRAYSWQFVKNVVMQKNDLQIPTPVIEQQAPVQARPVVNLIVQLVPQYRTKDGTLAIDAIEKLLGQEKLLGTPWREIADETIMELILKGLNAHNFIVALINAYDIPTSDVGLFLATPPDEGTMSLIEEAVCQDSLDLFLEVLRMDERLLKGLLECRDTTEQVHKEIFVLLNGMGAVEE